jgi:hypothetical protein
MFQPREHRLNFFALHLAELPRSAYQVSRRQVCLTALVMPSDPRQRFALDVGREFVAGGDTQRLARLKPQPAVQRDGLGPFTSWRITSS